MNLTAVGNSAFPDVRVLNLIRLDVVSGAERHPMGGFQRLIFPLRT